MMVEHHTHYKEIDGFDRTVWIEKGEHKRLHRHNHIPQRIAHNAAMRTKKQRDKINRNRLSFSFKCGEKTRVFEELLYIQNTGNVVISSWFGRMGT